MTEKSNFIQNLQTGMNSIFYFKDFNKIMKISSIKNWMKKSAHVHELRPAKRGSALAFTLIELLVAMTVFGLFIAALAGSYLFLTRAERDTNELRKVYSEGRFLMDEMIETARGSTIAYDCYNAVGGDGACDGSSIDALGESITGTVLATIRPDGKRVIIKGEECPDDSCYALKKVVQEYDELNGWLPSESEGYYGSPDGGFQNLNLEKVEVENIYFIIKPALVSSASSPYVQIYLSLEGVSQIRDSVDFDIQTTVSLRNY